MSEFMLWKKHRISHSPFLYSILLSIERETDGLKLDTVDIIKVKSEYDNGWNKNRITCKIALAKKFLKEE